MAVCRELLTDDFRFICSLGDSAGGSSSLPASITRLTLDKNFFVVPDPTHISSDPTGRWYRTIRTQVLLQIESADGHAIEISSAAIFYFVRGDLALIPDELKQRGFGPDSSRWYIRRWEDETDCRTWGAPARAGAPDRYLASTSRPLSARSSTRSR